jgi:hypothetical protein
VENHSEAWPLRPSAQVEAAEVAAALVICAPYGGLNTPNAGLVLTDGSEVLRPLTDSFPRVIELLRQGASWEALGCLAGFTEAWTQDDRDYAGLELVLGDGFIPDPDTIDDYALYWRRVDTALEAIGSGFAAHEVMNGTWALAGELLESAKSSTRALLTSEGLGDFLTIAHDTQSWATGVWIPGVDQAIRWGQRKLDHVGDEELAFALASDVIRLRYLASGGTLEPVRAYGKDLTEDLRQMSTRRASGGTVDARTRQISMFSVVLRMVSQLLGEDPDGLADDVAPSFMSMRLTEARQLAEAMAVTLTEVDGCSQSDETTHREIWQSDNWTVAFQHPHGGAVLGRRRTVRVWVMKARETVSPWQWSEYQRLGGVVSPSAAVPSIEAAPPSRDGRPFEFQPLAAARQMAATWGLHLVEHDGLQATGAPARQCIDPTGWYVRKQMPITTGRSNVDVWVLRGSEKSLTVDQATIYVGLLRQANGGGLPDNGAAVEVHHG